MIQWIKKHNYWALAGGVLLVAIAAIGFYTWHFREASLSKNTGDWADFATYLSGTVGVAAVVATLMAFVITLRQQKRLIDSQDDMLKKQDEQLEIAREQLTATERRNSVEQAYMNVKDVLPQLIGAFSHNLDAHFSPESGSELEDYLLTVYGGERVFTVDEFYKKPSRLLSYSKRHGVNLEEVSSYIEMVLGHSQHLCDFLIKQLAVERELFPFIDVQMSGYKGAAYLTYWFYIRCLLAYRMGVGSTESSVLACRMLRERVDYKNHPDDRVRNFYLLGEILNKK